MFTKILSLICILICFGCSGTIPNPPITSDQIEKHCRGEKALTPFMVGWDSSKQDELSTLYSENDSPIFIRYEQCKMRILSGCKQKVTEGKAYEAEPLPLHEEKVEMKSERSLYMNAPLAASNLKGGISSRHYLLLHYIKNRVGKLEPENLEGERVMNHCALATHYIDRITLGAYRLRRRKRLDISFFAGLFGGAESTDELKWNLDRGRLEECLSNSSRQRGMGCSSIINVRLQPVPKYRPKRRAQKQGQEQKEEQQQQQQRQRSVFDNSNASADSDRTRPEQPRFTQRAPLPDQTEVAPISSPTPSLDPLVDELRRASRLLNSGTADNCRESLMLLQRLANARNQKISGEAYYLQCQLYARGCGVNLKAKRAIKLCKEAAKRQHPRAIRFVSYHRKLKRGVQFILNDQCQEGLKVFQEVIRSSGDPLLRNKASYNTGVAYERGCGGEPDLRRAVAIYRRLANRNYPPALRTLGVMYVHGRHLEQDRQKGLRLLKRAAALGDDEARHDYNRLGGSSHD